MNILMKQIFGENYHWPDWWPVWTGTGDPPKGILEQFSTEDLLLIRADDSGRVPNAAGITWKRLAALPVDANGIKVLEKPTLRGTAASRRRAKYVDPYPDGSRVLVRHYIQYADVYDGGAVRIGDGPSLDTEMTVRDGKLWFDDDDDIPLDLQLVQHVELK